MHKRKRPGKGVVPPELDFVTELKEVNVPTQNSFEALEGATETGDIEGEVVTTDEVDRALRRDAVKDPDPNQHDGEGGPGAGNEALAATVDIAGKEGDKPSDESMKMESFSASSD